METNSKTNNPKALHLKPVWKRFALHYLLGMLTTPLLVGFYLIWRTWKKQSGVHYRITDRQISAIDDRYHQTIDLYNIDEVTLRRTTVQRWLGTGDLVLRTNSSEMTLLGMEDPEALKASIEQAVASIQESMKQVRKPDTREPEFDPGSMERMDYLTGLWQQGLLSDSDFEEERKRHE